MNTPPSKKRAPGAGRKSKSGSGTTKGIYFRPAPAIRQVLDNEENKTHFLELCVANRLATRQIIAEIGRILQKIHAPVQLQAIVNSFDDSLTDEEVLEGLKRY